MNLSATDQRRQRLSVAVLVAVLASAGVWWVRQDRRTVESEARRLLGCVRDGNADCVYDMTMPGEREAYGLTRVKVEDLLKEYLGPAMAGDPVGPVNIESMPDRNSASASMKIRLGPERQVILSVDVVKIDDGFGSPGLVTDLLAISGLAKHVPPGQRVLGSVKLKAWLKMTTDDAPLLTRLGFDGLFDEDRGRLRSWSELAQGNGLTSTKDPSQTAAATVPAGR